MCFSFQIHPFSEIISVSNFKKQYKKTDFNQKRKQQQSAVIRDKKKLHIIILESCAHNF